MDTVQPLKVKKVLIVLLLSLVTLGLYNSYWYINQLDGLNSLKSNEKLDKNVFMGCLISYIFGVIFMVLSLFYDEGTELYKTYDGISAVLYYVPMFILIFQSFKIKRILNDHFNVDLNYNISFSNLAVFFFWFYYLQYKINRIIKKASLEISTSVIE